MADPVFALSPISARSSLPTESDYDAIREAFMETARGRWFLNEYAKRNRNADTNLVLDAVSRLEATLASQKQDQRDRTPEIIAAISALVIEARGEAAVLISVRDTPDEDSPALKGVRVLREMAWTLRESGSDGRIPDLLSRQADAIEEGLKTAIDDTARDHLLSIFDRLAGDVDALGQGSGATTAPPPPVQPQAAAVADPDPVHETAAAPEASVAETAAFDDRQATELQAVADAIAADDVTEIATEPARVEQPQAATASVPAAGVAPAGSGLTPAGYVTIEASPMEDMELTWDEPPAASDAIAETVSIPEEIAPVAAAVAPELAAPPSPQPKPAPDVSVERMAALEAALLQRDEQPAMQPRGESETATLAKPAGVSLGESLLEKGIITRPDAPRGDPLAPFKRMTQAERVAFFS